MRMPFDFWFAITVSRLSEHDIAKKKWQLNFAISRFGFSAQTQKLEAAVQHNKQHHRKVPLSSFHLNGHTLGFHPHTQKLQPPWIA